MAISRSCAVSMVDVPMRFGANASSPTSGPPLLDASRVGWWNWLVDRTRRRLVRLPVQVLDPSEPGCVARPPAACGVNVRGFGAPSMWQLFPSTRIFPSTDEETSVRGALSPLQASGHSSPALVARAGPELWRGQAATKLRACAAAPAETTDGLAPRCVGRERRAAERVDERAEGGRSRSQPADAKCEEGRQQPRQDGRAAREGREGEREGEGEGWAAAVFARWLASGAREKLLLCSAGRGRGRDGERETEREKGERGVSFRRQWPERERERERERVTGSDRRRRGSGRKVRLRGAQGERGELARRRSGGGGQAAKRRTRSSERERALLLLGRAGGRSLDV
ncbi:hypothetical protein MPTK1_8g06480 [Marchantia polymorpha subsp. ruderalis]|uniref:Uncharacterized protein n=1 Tax=Marchantia polymorpha TaxID=3197 RepID=A0A2R6XIJ5_MARPO|nr:hypothetical protein MARPO_0013s0142 [Marchantia polymorpha]BBN18907.1 hypothetical protein Mp_8g06480 [Marchantia polymorpha subsp. ruderalis]|eukprot:PTQ45937.1 hypothetical protein MARPO_0013s0142 [Marchantia polymorpha]